MSYVQAEGRTSREAVIRPRLMLTIAGLTAIFLVFISPLALDLFGDGDQRWQLRSTIGQTYGAVSALVAALALGGVAASIVLQAREAKSSREFAMRSAHTDLIMAAIHEPDLRACFSFFDDSYTETEKRQHLYCNLYFQFWETRYVLGELKEQEIEALARTMANGAPGRRFWDATREYRLKYIDSAKALRFRVVFDTEYQRLVASAATSQPKQPSDESPTRNE